MLLAPAQAEPFGLSVLEAMAAGIPVLAAAGGAHLETVGLGLRPLLFEPGDARQLAGRLTCFAVEQEMDRRERSDAMRELQRGRFSQANHVRVLRSFYSTLARWDRTNERSAHLPA
jgi:glycosyltransferase involved in cell wall biosynthesis